MVLRRTCHDISRAYRGLLPLLVVGLVASCIRTSLSAREFANDGSIEADAGRDIPIPEGWTFDAPPPPRLDGFTAEGEMGTASPPQPLVGELDLSFGQQGQLTLERGTDVDIRIYGVAARRDGSLYLQGRRYTGNGRANFITARLLVDGSLDEGYGSYGYVLESSSVYSYGYGVLIRPTGGLLLIGDHSGGSTRQDDILVIALLENGFRDLAYGTSGQVAIDFGNTEDTSKTGALDSQGRLVLCGTAGYDLTTPNSVIVRLTPQGQVDSSFGAAGIVRIDGGGAAKCAQLITLADDEIVAVGQATSGTEVVASGMLLHLDAAGASLFSNGSSHKTYADSRGLTFQSVRQSADGSFFVAGTFGATQRTIALLRFDGDGGVVTGFGSGGRAEIDFGGDDRARALSIGPDGRVVVAGVTNAGGDDDFAFARITTAGQPDGTFGQGGQLSVDFAGQIDSLHALARLEDGRLIAVGWTDSGTVQKPALLRLR